MLLPVISRSNILREFTRNVALAIVCRYSSLYTGVYILVHGTVRKHPTFSALAAWYISWAKSVLISTIRSCAREIEDEREEDVLYFASSPTVKPKSNK